MIEWVVVDNPVKFPMSCSGCLGQKGPMVDTHRESPIGHVYFCQECVKKSAVLLGYAEGAKAEELGRAVAALFERDKEIKELKTLLNSEREVTGFQEALVEKLKAEQELDRGRIEQLETRIRQAAEAELALVGGAVSQEQIGL